ncbi:MAG: hypothetical protein IJ530_10935 [Treponema sp.]|uniref:hypothetical protein n=1 Tax=Treponema sp. TaxID=166 RepID=UPI0025E2EC9A|nr:hypothetical protein [Treponema sp.]MBQ8680263.1 hypothetical protein [Treponema sp.]
MNELGYSEVILDSENFKLHYPNKGDIIFIIKNKYAQVLIKFEKPKFVIALKHLALLSENLMEIEKMRNSEDAFFYDNFYEFEGFLNYVWLVLKERGEFIFSDEGNAVLRKKIEEKKQNNEIFLKSNIKNKIQDLLKASAEWKKKVRFTEECYHKLKGFSNLQ